MAQHTQQRQLQRQRLVQADPGPERVVQELVPKAALVAGHALRWWDW